MPLEEARPFASSCSQPCTTPSHSSITSTQNRSPPKVVQGRASPDELEEEEAVLGEMSSQLETLRSSYNTLWSHASGVLRGLAGSTTVTPAGSAVIGGSGVVGGGGSSVISAGGSPSATTTTAAAVAAALDGAALSSLDGGGGTTSLDASGAGVGGVGAGVGGTRTGGSAVVTGGTQSGASRAVFAGLKFSGLAMRITQDIALSVKADAERMFKVRFGCCRGTAVHRSLCRSSKNCEMHGEQDPPSNQFPNPHHSNIPPPHTFLFRPNRTWR
jgi:hypothetical protein